MGISLEVEELIKEEERILQEVLASLNSQYEQTANQFLFASRKANSLTQEIFQTRRAEDKQQMVSDELVSHGLRDLKRDEERSVEELLKRPYFARVVMSEVEKGKNVTREFRLSTASNPACRIVDWRRAPISKLYYEYKEGDYYIEDIQGREREGTIILRHKVDIENGVLVGLACKHGNFAKINGEWQEGRASTRNGSYGQIPDVLSLISAEQFRLITEEDTSGLIIQGVAGSGKTTVALHRLSWLLKQKTKIIRADRSLVIVKSKILKQYIERSLDVLGLSGVNVATWSEWSAKQLGAIMNLDEVKITEEVPPAGVARVKGSMAIIQAIEQRSRASAKSATARTSLQDELCDILNSTAEILAVDETRILDREVLERVGKWQQQLLQRGEIDNYDRALLLRIYAARGGRPLLANSLRERFDHIVIDEAQDWSAAELAVMIGFLESREQLTLIGDRGQDLQRESVFPGWERLCKYWDKNQSLSRFVSLKVSYRCSYETMKLANYVRGNPSTPKGRRGPKPLWFHSHNENDGICTAINWLEDKTSADPNALVLVICSSPGEARMAFSMLEPKFGVTVRLGDEESFTFEEGVVVSTAATVKGLDFPHVLIWNPSTKNYPLSEDSRGALYVAITRAERSLALTTWERPSKLLPALKSALVDGVLPEVEEEEESYSWGM